MGLCRCSIKSECPGRMTDTLGDVMESRFIFSQGTLGLTVWPREGCLSSPSECDVCLRLHGGC